MYFKIFLCAVVFWSLSWTLFWPFWILRIGCSSLQNLIEWYIYESIFKTYPKKHMEHSHDSLYGAFASSFCSLQLNVIAWKTVSNYTIFSLPFSSCTSNSEIHHIRSKMDCENLIIITCWLSIWAKNFYLLCMWAHAKASS